MKRTDERTILRRSALLAVLPLSAALLLFPVRRAEASAGAAPYFEGTSASSVAVIGATSVELKSASLTLSIPCYGACGYGETAPKAVAVYTLYNPTESDETVSLAYPYELVQTAPDRESWNDPKNCSLRADGSEIDYSVYYTYRNAAGFDAMSCLTRFDDQDEFYTPELPVIKYTYRIALAEGEEDAYIKLYLKGTVQSKIVRGDDCITSMVENGYRCLVYRVNGNAGEVSYYSLGGENEVVCVGYARKDRAATRENAPSYTLAERVETTFAQYLQEQQPEAFSQQEWLHIAADFFNDSEYNGMLPSLSSCVSCSFVRWYAYTLTVPAGGMVEHTVTAPLYPASSPYANRFQFQIAPLSGFRNCGEITIEVQTPFYIQYSTVEFEQTENGYSFSRDALPYGELSFSLTQEVTEQQYIPDNDRHDPLAAAICILAVLVAGAVVVAVVLTVRTRRIRKESERALRRAEMARPEEGKIDDGNKNGRA